MSEFEEGDRVVHDGWGEGTVREVYENTVSVDFDVGVNYRDYPSKLELQ